MTAPVTERGATMPRVSTRAGPSPTDAVLDVGGLCVEFGPPDAAVRVVDDVSFQVAAGEIVGVVGESGSGKTVTALAVMGLAEDAGARVTAGAVRLDGVDLLALGERDLRRLRGRDIAMIFQDPMTSLNPVMTVGAQIAEAVRLHEPVARAAARRRAIEMLELAAVPEPARRARQYPHELSGGLRQRAMIAMALSCSPRVLIADEPTTALDVTIQAELLDLLADLRARLGIAIVLISHDLGVIAEVADRVQVMYAGRIVEAGPAPAVLDAPAHPYSAALLGCVPWVDDDGAPLVPIPGFPPARVPESGGCAYWDRCHVRSDPRCETERPPLVEISAGRWVASFCVGAPP